MFWLRVAGLSILLSCCAVIARGQNDVCLALIKAGIQDKQHTFTSTQAFAFAQQVYCFDQSMTFESASQNSANLGISLVNLIDATLGGSTNSSNFSARRTQFCSMSLSTFSNNAVVIQESQSISANAVNVLESCLQSPGFSAVVIPSNQLNSFAIDIHNNAQGDNSVTVTELSSQPIQVSCNIKLNKPHSVPFSILCRKPPETTIQVTMNTNRGGLRPIEVLGTDRVLPEMQGDIRALASQVNTLSGQVQQQLSAINDRISGIRLISGGITSLPDFDCGHEAKADNDPLLFMVGSRDGTSCGIRNVNFVRRLDISIPPQAH